jgi:hypothetical protein
MTQLTEVDGDSGDGLLTGPVRTESGWSAGLAVPQGHPFFFDHPLDHVSGALTICGFLDLAGAVTGPAAEADRLLLDLRFPAMGTLTEATELSIAAAPGTPGRWSLAAHQADVEICGGTLQRITGIGRAGTRRLPGGREALCPQDLVHRADEDNVVLGVPENGAEAVTAPVVPAGPGHYLDPGGPAFSAAGLIESSRQFFTVLEHWAAGWPHGTKMVWLTFHADLPAVPSSPAYSFRWVREPVKGSKLAASFDLLDADGEIAGRFDYVSVNVSPAAYERFRAARTRLAGEAAA